MTASGGPQETGREVFPPPSFNAPVGIVGWSIFILRLVFDARVGSVWRAARRELPRWRGLVLDVGCGDGPWKWLLHPAAIYIGLDVPRAASAFGYARGRGEQVTYDGRHFPFADARFSHLLCTEVLEHVEEPPSFLRECWRVTTEGGRCFFSVPFAARYHYAPFDYWRFTPAALQKLFAEAGWSDIRILALGTDVTVAAHKANALILKLFLGVRRSRQNLFVVVAALLLFPVFILLTALQLASLVGRWGSDYDPVGYIVLARRPVTQTRTLPEE